MMESKDITFLFQGAVDKAVVCESFAGIRKNFPRSEIILSTWAGTDVSGLDFDSLVLSKDPGFFLYSKRPGEKANNVNRQIVGTRGGLEKVTSPYCFRMRTDFILSGDRFLSYFDAFPKKDDEYAVFSKKLLAACYFTRNPRSRSRFPFHPSDLAFFGKTDDIKMLFDIPLMTEDEADWDVGGRRYNRYTPEQYIFVNALRQMGRSVPCDYYNDATEIAVSETEKYFASNFILLTFDQFNLTPSKQTFIMKVHPNSFMTCYTHNEWLELYRLHVDPNATVPVLDLEREKIKRYYRPYRFFRLIGNALSLVFRNKLKRRTIRNRVLEFFLRPR